MEVNRIALLRKEKNLSQRQLAEAIHVHQTAVSQWETGRTSPDMQALQTLASFFNVTVDYLLGRSDETNTAQPESTADDPDIWELREKLRRSPGMRTLFSTTKNATEEDLMRAARVIEALRGADDGVD